MSVCTDGVCGDTCHGPRSPADPHTLCRELHPGQDTRGRVLHQQPDVQAVIAAVEAGHVC